MQFINMTSEMNYIQKRQIIKNKLKKIVESKDYVQVEPDYFEHYERFIHLNQRIPKEKLVTFIGEYGVPMILRPDITSSIISYLIPKYEENTFLKLYYDSTYFRRDEHMKVIEYKQFGVEFLGSNSLITDAEVICLAMELLSEFSSQFVFVINQNEFLLNLLDLTSISNQELQTFFALVNKKNKSELNNFLNQKNINQSNKDLLYKLFDFQGDYRELLSKFDSFQLNDTQKNILNDLSHINDLVESKYPNIILHYDLSLISNYDYYQGILFKAFMKDQPKSVLDGGRYDLLTQAYGKKIPAIGFSIDIQELITEVIKP